MENLEWDSEIKEEQDNQVGCDEPEPYSCLYKYYADILNQTADILNSTSDTLNTIPNLNQYDVYGRTALHYACQSGNAQIVQLLIERGANVNDSTKYDCISPLHLAARHSADILNILMDSSARLELQDANGRTPLHHAASHGKYN